MAPGMTTILVVSSVMTRRNVIVSSETERTVFGEWAASGVVVLDRGSNDGQAETLGSIVSTGVASG